MTTGTGMIMIDNFNKGFERFQREVGGDDAFGVYFLEVMKLLVETCYHWTAPPTKGNRGARGGRKGGKSIVAQDVAWMTAGVSQRYLDLLQFKFGNGPIAATEFRNKNGETYLIDNVIVNASGSVADIERYHQSRRKANGRVLTHATQTSQNIGRWSPRDKMLMTKEVRDSYIKNTQKRVGKLKSGWLYALEQTKSKLPPGWVAKAGNMAGHSGFAPAGGFENALKPTQWEGYMAAVNRVPYFRDSDGFMKRAHLHVERFMDKGGKPLEGFLDRMIKRHSQVKT